MNAKDYAYKLVQLFRVPISEAVNNPDGITGGQTIGVNKGTHLKYLKYAKQCALITVDEILNGLRNTPEFGLPDENYFNQIKEEIKKI